MKTSFTPEQLADPATTASEKAIRTCVHCGFCTATCPTYVLLGDERDSPLGRIYMIQQMLEKDAAPTPEVVTHIDRCLSCLGCVTTCPSGVDYMHLIDHARVHVAKTYRRPLGERMLRWMLATLMPHRGRFAAALWLGPMVAPFAGLADALGARRMAAMMRTARARRIRVAAEPPGEPGGTRGRVIMQAGCVEPVLRPRYQAAAARLLTRLGYAVLRAPEEGCCGSIVHHLGREEEALKMIRATVDGWAAILDAGPVEAIVVTASGCGVTIKDYGFMLRNDPAYADKAARVSKLARDISEFVRADALQAAPGARKLRVAWQAPCTLQHGHKIGGQPKALLERAGVDVVTPAEAHLCCGSAGTYSMLQPEIADRLGKRKAAALEALKPDVIATANIGCAMHLAVRTGVPVVHIAELLDWATGGPAPAGLETKA
jgi:glycolate oxidase iron-sulfur subunit